MISAGILNPSCSGVLSACSDLARMLVADGGMLAGVGQDLGPIPCHGDLPDLQKLQRLRQFQHPHKGLLQERLVLAPESANRVVIGVGVAANQALSLIHISEPTRQAEISYAVFCLKKK